MNVPIAYYVRVGAAIQGPYDLARLKELASTRAITPETEAALSKEGPWSLMITLPEKKEIFPAAVGLAAGAKFAATADSATPVYLEDVIASSATPGPILRSRKELEADVYRPAKAATPQNEVEEMVRSVQAREAEFAPPVPPPPKRKLSRRLVLVLTLAVLGNAVLGVIPLVYGTTGDEFGVMILRGWFVIFNGGLVAVYFGLPKE